MPVSQHSSVGADRLQWLVDRAEISDLLVEFARALDERDPDAYAALYVEDGVLEFPGLRIEGRERLRAAVGPTLERYSAVWHMSSNHAIEIHGDVARARSYMLAVHRHGDDPSHHADGAGWYDNVLRRTSDGWRLQSVSLKLIWTGGDGPLPGQD